MNEGEINELSARAAEFDHIIYEARSTQHADLPPEVAKVFVGHDPVLGWKIDDFIKSYQVSAIYPIERLPGVVDRLIDTKLQLHYVTQVFPGTMNLMVYLRGFDPKKPLDTPGLQLARLAYAQALIGASRVGWDRLMRMIYYLETGKEPPGKSVRRRFFGDLPNWSPRWDILAEWESEVDLYDSSYRTPEYHKGSILKRELLGGEEVDMNDVLGLSTPMTSGLWTVLISNVEGKPYNLLSVGRHVRQPKSEPK